MYASASGPRNQPPDGPAPHLPDPHRPGGEPGPNLPPFEDPRDEPRRGEPDRPPERDRPREPDRPTRRLAYAALAAAPLAFMLASTAAAETCKEELERFARQYDLSTTAPQARLREGDPVTPPAPPMTAESRGLTTTDRLKDSGGVIEPPDAGAARVMPPPPTGDRMATAPDVRPQSGGGQAAGSSGDSLGELDAADRSKLEALLMGGRDAAERGQEQDCMQRLDEARRLVEPKSR
jgi:hypothetical protein